MYEWLFEVIMYGNRREFVTVHTETTDYYEAESAALALPGVWDVGSYVEDPMGRVGGHL